MFHNFDNPNLTTGDAFFGGVLFTLAVLSLLTTITILFQNMLFNASLIHAKSSLFGAPLPRWVVWLDWVMSIPQTVRNAIHNRRQDRVA